MFAMILGVVWVVSAARAKSRKEIQKTLQVAINNNAELTPEAIKALGAKPANPYADLRSGVILIAVALAFVLLGFGISTVDDMEVDIVAVMAGVAAFPGLVGLALIGMHFLVTEKSK